MRLVKNSTFLHHPVSGGARPHCFCRNVSKDYRHSKPQSLAGTSTVHAYSNNHSLPNIPLGLYIIVFPHYPQKKEHHFPSKLGKELQKQPLS